MTAPTIDWRYVAKTVFASGCNASCIFLLSSFRLIAILFVLCPQNKENEPRTTYIRQSLHDIYPPGELRSLTKIICCDLLGQDAIDYYLGKDITLSANEQCDLESIVERLKKNEPIQYIQGETCFYGSMFRVAPGVLIPRPETEELVDLIVKEAATGTRLLDIGTGSGCIAISLAKHIPQAVVTAWDVSEEALAIAGENNRELKAGVHFEKIDVLSAEPVGDDQYDMIVSNPPYVTESEKKRNGTQCVRLGARTGLFVPDNDPLRFYRRIAFFRKEKCYACTAGSILRSIGLMVKRLSRCFTNKDMKNSV